METLANAVLNDVVDIWKSAQATFKHTETIFPLFFFCLFDLFVD